VPGLLLFSLRLFIEALLTPVRAVRRVLGADAPSDADRYEAAAPREPRPPRTSGSVSGQVHVAEPWPGYDGMRLDDVLARLQAVPEVELAVVRAYEREHEARQAVLLVAGETV
jgi:hypothetical protein